MELVRRLRNHIRAIADAFKRILTARSQSRGFATQRVCPFCGLITPRNKRLCLECGKSLRGIPMAPKGAPQE